MNKGNVLFQKGDHEKAREYYREALSNDSSCVEALYNLGIGYVHLYASSVVTRNCHKIKTFFSLLGLSNKKLKRYEDALDSFYKLHAILRNSAQVMYQIADMYPFFWITRLRERISLNTPINVLVNIQNKLVS